MSRQTESKKRKKNKKKIKFNALTIWIVIEAVVLFIVVAAALVINFYIGGVYEPKPYSNPSKASTQLDVEDIELPTDLMNGD